MTIERNSRLPDLWATLASSDHQYRELRAGIALDRVSTEDRMRALQELARLSSDITSLLLDVIRTESN
jgi:hypothetical protein